MAELASIREPRRGGVLALLGNEALREGAAKLGIACVCLFLCLGAAVRFAVVLEQVAGGLDALAAAQLFVGENPKLIERFLKGFFASMAYYRSHKAQSIAIGAKVVHSSLAVASQAYDTQIKLMVPDGAFDPQGLKVLKESFMALHLLPKEPADGQMLTRRFLPVTF